MCNMLLLLLLAACIITEVESWRPGKPMSSIRSGKYFTAPVSFETLYFDQQIDHIGYTNGGTFKQRYLLADQFWNRKGGPIFFYTGNEGDIELFCNNTGFLWELASDFKALLVYAEHRYYGLSLPFGDETYKDVRNLNYLSSEQALADFVELVKYLKTLPGAANSPVIAFGGSYGGMLAAWLRMKYPNLVFGALASSAPIWQFTGLTPCNGFYDVASNTWLSASKICVENVHVSYQALDDLAGQAGGLKAISDIFKLCTPLHSKPDLDAFKEFLGDVYVDYALVNYPYPADFLANLPAWPVKVACSYLSQPLTGLSLLTALSNVTNLYFNYTGQTKCVNWTEDALGYHGWEYQACTQMVMPVCSSFSGMFYNITWDFQKLSDACYSKYKVRPNQDWIATEYWAKQLQYTSNIIFSNGLFDPWSSGGVMRSISQSIIAIQIPYGAHYFDLRAQNPLDTRAVLATREQEANILRNWLHLNPV